MDVDNEADDWLALDSEPAKQDAGPIVEKSRIVPDDLKNNEPATPSVVPLSLDDEFRLEPVTQKSTRPQKPVSPPPDQPSKRSVFDDDLPDLLPMEMPELEPLQKPNVVKSEPPAPKPNGSRQGTNSKPKTERPAGSPLLSGSLEALSLQSPAIDPDMVLPKDEEFRFPCKVCGTLLYAELSRVGSQTRCPDCYTEFSIPSPPVKKKQPTIQLEEGPGVTFAPIDAENVRSDSSSKQKTDEILDRAAAEVDREVSEDSSGTFDTKRWMGLIFGFLQDKLIIAGAVVLGLACAAWFYSIMAVGSILSLEETPSLIVSIGLFLVFCIPILGSVCMCGLAIITMAANRSPKVTDWPFTRFGEAIGECMMVLVSMLAASIPGGMMGALTNTLGAHPLLTIGFIMLSIWAITPLLLLSMIDSSSIFEPFSKEVFDSIKSFSDAWGAMYMQSALAFAGVWTLFALAISSHIGAAIAGFCFPFMCFFIFNQYGVLAGRISGVTHMGFEGDFSDD